MFERKRVLTKDERDAMQDSVLDKGIEVTTLGVVGSGVATATGEVMHVVTGGVLWGHLTGTMMALFHGAVALDVTFIGYRLYRLMRAQAKEGSTSRELRIKEMQLDRAIEELETLKSGETPA